MRRLSTETAKQIAATLDRELASSFLTVTVTFDGGRVNGFAIVAYSPDSGCASTVVEGSDSDLSRWIAGYSYAVRTSSSVARGS